MSLRIEKIFGMLSLAALGFLAISCVPNVKESAAKDPVEVTAAPSEKDFPIDLEVDAVRQVEMMNAQARPAFTAGGSSHQGD
jgi:hypothetical protein